MAMEIKAIRPTKRFLHISIWSSLIILYSLVLLDRDINTMLYLSMTALLTLLSAATIYRLWYTLIPKYLEKGRSLKFSFSLLSWLFFDGIILLNFLTLILGFVRDTSINNLPGLAGSGFKLIALMWLVIIAWAIIIIARNQNEARLRMVELQQELAESEGQRKELELDQLKSQLQPHFLFNTLNTIYGAALKKSEEVPDMIMQLSAMLDYGLYQASKTSTLLTEEVEHLERYLGLEKQRFRDGLQINFEKNGDFTIHSIPPLLLMPLVENAIKHGKVIEGQLTIDMSLTVADKTLDFEVQNPFQASENVAGIGLTNLKKRLQNLYPDQYRLVHEDKDGTFKSMLKIPLDA